MRTYLLSLCLLSLAATGCREKNRDINGTAAAANSQVNAATGVTQNTADNTQTETSAPESNSASDSENKEKEATRKEQGVATDAFKRAPAQAQSSWSVLSYSGNWVQVDGGSRPLARGDELPAGAIVRLQSRTGEIDYITLINRANNVIRKKCPSSADCGDWRLPEAPVRDSLVSRIIEAALSIWRREPEKYESLSSRGGLLEDAVVRLKNGTVDLSPVFMKMDAHTYYLEFQTMSGEKLPVLAYHWRKDEPQLLEAPTLKPGLYKMELMDAADKYRQSRNLKAWVLVSPDGSYERLTASYRQAVAAIGQRPDKTDDAAQADLDKSLLRAYLDYLAAEERKKR